MTTPEPVPDLELIASFIDGRLAPADRERAIKMLASSEAAFEVFAAAVRAREDATPDVVPITSARRRGRRRRWWLLLPAAAAAALMVAILPKVGPPPASNNPVAVGTLF